MVAEAGDNLGVGEHLGQGLEDKAGRGQVMLPENGCEAVKQSFYVSDGQTYRLYC